MTAKKILQKALPKEVISGYHFCLAFLAAFLSGFPSRKLKVIGVTGTNGKTTTCLMITRILEEAGFKVGSVSTLFYKIADKETANPKHMTMPGRFVLQKALRQMKKAGCQYAVLEITSEGVKQFRHKFINFSVAVLTNLSPEHIEAHGNFEKYKEAKAKFFRATKDIHILNKDDNNFDYFAQIPAKEKIYFSLEQAGGLLVGESGSSFVFRGQRFDLQLPGIFNVCNALAVLALGASQNIEMPVMARVLAKIKNVPGRFEIIKREPFKIIIDVAHTPEAVEKVYQQSQKMLGSDGRLIVVFGAAGGLRDHWKRPRLGQLAAQYCSTIILTNEDPYNEPPEKIIREIRAGITSKEVFEILDRKQAIVKAVSFAKISDVVLLLGKGTEPNMVFENNRKALWNEKQVALDALRLFLKNS